MSKLDAATARLNSALERLERAALWVGNRSAQPENPDLAALQKERDALRDQLTELAAANEEIGARVDGAIAEIDTILNA